MLEEVMSDLATDYTPEKGRNNPHVKSNWYILAAFTAGCAIPVLVTQLIGLLYVWPNDPYVEFRWTAKTLLKLFVAFVCADFYLTYRDWRVNGNLFKGLIQNPMGCAIFAGAVFYGIVLVCISSVM